jgi:hypothetical protein
MDDKTRGTYFFVFLNSVILFITATLLENFLHQSGHFLMAKWVGLPDVSMHHNYVNFDDSQVSNLHKVLVNGAGPLLSLLTGIIFQFLCLGRLKRDLVFMFQNYMAIFGYIGFFGYLIITPFYHDGDLGKVLQLLNFPLWSVIIISFLSLVTLYVIMFRLTRNFVLLCPIEALEIKYARRRFMFIMIFYPFIIGVLLTTLLNLPVKSIVDLIAPFIMPFAMLWTFPQALVKEYRGAVSNDHLESINNFSLFPVVALVIIVLVNRLLVTGLSF